MKLAIIAAVARNGVIGRGGKIPWHLSEDLKRFKRLTVGHAVLMGRRTWESLGRPLVDRRNVVLSARPIPGAESYPTAEQALEALAGEERVFVIGGAAVYARFLGCADELYLTLVDQEPEGDTRFPPYEELLRTRYRLTRREDYQGYHFVDYIKNEG